MKSTKTFVALASALACASAFVMPVPSFAGVVAQPHPTDIHVVPTAAPSTVPPACTIVVALATPAPAPSGGSAYVPSSSYKFAIASYALAPAAFPSHGGSATVTGPAGAIQSLGNLIGPPIAEVVLTCPTKSTTLTGVKMKTLSESITPNTPESATMTYTSSNAPFVRFPHEIPH